MKYLLGVSVTFKSQLFCHNLGYCLRNAERSDHQQDKVNILGIIEKTHTVISKSIGKRTFIEHSDDLGDQCRDHQE